MDKLTTLAVREAAKYAMGVGMGYFNPKQPRINKGYGHPPNARRVPRRPYNKKKRNRKNGNQKKTPNKPKSKYQKIASKVQALEQCCELDSGTLIYRLNSTDKVSCAVNSQFMASKTMNGKTAIENVLTNLKYYDPSNPATLLTASGITGAFSKDFQFKNCYFQATCKNNYQVPCEVTIYAVQSKADTNIVATVAYTNGLTDVGAPSNTSVLVHITDSLQFTDLYNIKHSKKNYLQPGQQMEFGFGVNDFTYDPSLSDSHSNEFQKTFNDVQFVIRVQGQLSHDTVADEQGLSIACVDVLYEHKWEVRYVAGADIKLVVASSGLNAPTNGFINSNKPISDNQAFSLA